MQPSSYNPQKSTIIQVLTVNFLFLALYRTSANFALFATCKSTKFNFHLFLLLRASIPSTEGTA